MRRASCRSVAMMCRPPSADDLVVLGVGLPLQRLKMRSYASRGTR